MTTVLSSTHYDDQHVSAVVKSIADLVNAEHGQAGVTGSATTLSSSVDGKIVNLDRAGGSTVTLPAAAASGIKFRLRVKTAGAYTISCGSGNSFTGVIEGIPAAGGAVRGYAAAAGTSNTLTLTGTNGGVTVGEWVELEDVATGTAGNWQVRGMITATGTATAATPFSAS